MEPVVVDSEVVRDFVEDGAADLGHQFRPAQPERQVRLPKDRDLVRHDAVVVDPAFG